MGRLGGGRRGAPSAPRVIVAALDAGE